MTNTFFRFSFLVCMLLLGSCFAPGRADAQVVPAPTAKQLADLDKLMAPYRKKLATVLAADKTGQYKTYLADLNALVQTKDPAAHDRLAEKLKQDHYQFIKKAYTKAVVNHEDIKRGVVKILGHNKFTIDEFGGINANSFLPKATLPLKFDATLTAPYDASQHESNITVVGEDCKATVTDAAVHTRSGALFDGGCRSKGSLGDKFDLPQGTFQKITLTAQFNFDYRGFAYAVGGYSQVNAKIGLRLMGPGLDKIVIVRERWCVAPLIWFSEFNEGVNDFVAQQTFTGTFAGGTTFTAQVYNETFAIALSPVLGSSSESKSNSQAIDFIKVSASN